jgi:hypothetical protein
MKKIDAKKNNPMIAEFMGYKLITPEMRRHPENWKYSYWENPDDDDVVRKVLGEEDSLDYDSSYNSLMRVVDKIESLGNCIQTKLSKDMGGNYSFGIIWYQNYDSGQRRDCPSRIEAIYSEVVDFIKHYNTNIKDAEI